MQPVGLSRKSYRLEALDVCPAMNCPLNQPIDQAMPQPQPPRPGAQS
jgi:hypothetical protein